MTSRPRVSLSFSGKAFSLLGIFIMLAASNAGNNLLFLLSAGIFSLVGVAVGMGTLNLLGLEYSWEQEAEGFAGSQVELNLNIKEPGRRHRFLLNLGGTLLPILGFKGSARLAISLFLERRGRFEIDGLELVSGYPLGLVSVSLQLPAGVAWAFPAPKPEILRGPAESQISGRLDMFDQSGDFWMLSPYQPGQNCRCINWVISSRSDREWVVVQAIPREEPLRVWLDTETAAGRQGKAGVEGGAGEKDEPDRAGKTGEADKAGRSRGASEARVAGPAYEAGEKLELFLERVSGLFLHARSQHTALFAWCAEPGAIPGWVAVRDPCGCTRLLRWLAILQPGPASHPPMGGLGQEGVLRVGPESFGGSDL
ncbi:hypothetical protein AUK22_08690 [bacterium CG2_30_54_10]|nr:MAG: hypothetical protein AUK22_08690 [bacterium CG2_30_54_10]